jgi:prepilin-type N-terminal cleavage/methylation domain-containing protein
MKKRRILQSTINQKPSTVQSAFTLVELAIAIVIISLLLAGVMQGSELIKQAQVRSFTKLAQTFQSANNTFKMKYNFLPGDLPNATTFFDTTTCNNMTYSNVPCNSNQSNAGNGLIDGTWNTDSSDQMRYWVHLSLSKILTVNPVGTSDYSYNRFDIGKNRTWSVVGTGGFLANMALNYGPSTATVAFTNINYFAFFNHNGPWDGSIISAPDAASVDEKLDDGKPLTGKFLAGTGSNNSTTECIVGTEYNFLSDAISCNLFLAFE